VPILYCESCGGNPADKPDDVESFRCSSCNQISLAKLDAHRRKQAEVFSPERCKKLRKAEGFTQQELSFHLNLAKTIVGRYERGAIEIPPPVLVDWMEERM